VRTGSAQRASTDDLSLRGVDDRDAEVRDVGAVEVAAVGGDLEVGGVTVFELPAGGFDVEWDLGEQIGGASVEDEDGPAFAAAPIQQRALGEKSAPPALR